MAIFLRMNKYNIITSADEGERFIINDVIQNKISIIEISNWLEKYMEKVNL